MSSRALLVFAVMSVGCAVASNDGTTVGGKPDTGKPVSTDVGSDDTSTTTGDSASPGDTGSTDPDSSEPSDSTTSTDTTVPDDTMTVVDTGTPPMEAAVDTAPTDAGALKVLVYDDYPGIPSHAPAAVTALGGTSILCDDATGVTTWDAGGFNVVIIEASNVGLTTGLDTRLVTWMTGGGRLIFSHWKLDSTTALTTELGVTVSSYSTARPIYKDASTVDFFAGTKESFTSPITGPGTTFGVHGFTLTVTSPSFLAGRADSASGPGLIAVTHGGKVVVNGFLSADFASVDADSDGKMDVQELLTNELAYVLTK
ncbi:MAG: hypothetical protein ACXVEF_34790 [Polyangiales bacterium]